MIAEWLVTTRGTAAIGGGLVGFAAALLIVRTGKVMDPSDMLGGLLGGNEGPAAAHIAFLAGLVLAPMVRHVWVASPATGGTSSGSLVLLTEQPAGFGARLGSTGVNGKAILCRAAFEAVAGRCRLPCSRRDAWGDGKPLVQPCQRAADMIRLTALA
ncbi:MAG: hypothetical protein H9533_16295 [Rhodobacteraceae bacterium]|nr:hypothetical protein [Paracoccaceae bacterium]